MPKVGDHSKETSFFSVDNEGCVALTDAAYLFSYISMKRCLHFSQNLQRFRQSSILLPMKMNNLMLIHNIVPHKIAA